MPAARRLYYALELLSQPSLLEPIFICDINVPTEYLDGVYQTLNHRKAQIVEEIQIAGNPLKFVFYILT